MQQASNIQQIHCRCCYTIIEDIKNSVEFTSAIKLIFQELVQFEIDARTQNNSEFICSRCDLKLQEFTAFKAEVIETQQKFKSLLKPEEIKIEVTEIFVQDFKQEPIIKLKRSPGSRRRQRKSRADLTTDEDHFCPMCNKFFTEARKVKLHIDRIHLQKKDFQCDLCPYAAFKKYDILLHLNNIHKPKELLEKTSTCDTCGLSFSSNSRLNIHIKRKHLKQVVRNITCDICGHRSSAVNEIRRHMLTHRPKDLKESFPCVDCGAVLSSKGSLKVHRDSKHSDMPSIVCFCGKSFRQKSVYIRHHQVLHEGIKAFKCSFCMKEFSGKSHLSYHVRNVHSVVTSVMSCERCGNQYKNEDTLKKHMIYHDPPRFECAVCCKKFYENKKLMDHMSAHERLEFPCQHCARSFRLESQLRYHLKKVHFKEKLTFHCELCTSTFTRKSTYRDHAMRQHKELEREELAMFLERIKTSLAEEQRVGS